jgi:hypothetical protein
MQAEESSLFGAPEAKLQVKASSPAAATSTKSVDACVRLASLRSSFRHYSLAMLDMLR